MTAAGISGSENRQATSSRTLPFTTRAGDYLSVLLSLWFPRYGWMLMIPIAVCALVGIVYDERFLLIALMLVFIVIPMLSSFLYPYYMLTPEARRAVVRKEVEIVEGKHLRLVYLREEGDSTDSRPVPEPETIPWGDVIRVKYTARFRVYILKAPRLSFLLIPHGAFIKS